MDMVEFISGSCSQINASKFKFACESPEIKIEQNMFLNEYRGSKTMHVDPPEK
jgi:hypothetical protein